MNINEAYDIVVSIVDRNLTSQVLDEIEKIGVTGSTVLQGRGRSSRQTTTLFGFRIEPERDCILTLTPREKTHDLYNTILDTGNLHKPGHGLVLVLEVKQVGGLSPS